MQFQMTVQMDSDALTQHPGLELARILRAKADSLEDTVTGDRDGGPVRDINGAKVGQWEITA